MSRRRIGQEALRLAPDQRSGGSSLDHLVKLIDWAPIEGRFAGVHAAARGEPAWPPLALFKAMLLAVWYGLSEVKLADALDDRASFRRFCGFSAHERTPERTAFVRFRRELVTRGLDKALFGEVTAQLRAKAVTVKTGTLIDATVIASASHADDEAAWAGHQRRRAVHGFKAHVSADAETALVEELAVTLGNVHDGRAGGAALPEDPGEAYADSAYRGEVFGAAVRAKGGAPRIVATGCGADLATARRASSVAGARPFNASAAGSRRSSAPGSAATACGACDGEGWPRPACRFVAPQSPTTSNEPPPSSELRRPEVITQSSISGRTAAPLAGRTSNPSPYPSRRE